MRKILPLSLALLGLSLPALAEDASQPSFSFSGGAGVIALEANEYVVTGDFQDSQLIWQSVAPVLTGGLDVRFPEGWTISAKAAASTGGDSYMEDYDWIDWDEDGPFVVGQGPNNWTDRSQSPDTGLDHYFSGSLALGHDFVVTEHVTLNANAGFKYTDVKWGDRGGSYIYSNDGFRNDIGNFEDEPGIIYQQKLPVAFVGLDATIVQDAWTFGVSAQAGLTINAGDIDHHLLRDLVFYDNLYTAPALEFGASIAYAFTETTSLKLAGTVDQIFYARGDTDMFDADGTLLGSFPDSAAGDFQSLSATIGLISRF